MGQGEGWDPVSIPFEPPKDVWEKGDDGRFCTTPIHSKAEGQFYVGSVGGAEILPHPQAGKEVSVGTGLPQKVQAAGCVKQILCLPSS